MMSASAMSAAIRAKKKKMMEEPQDLQDAEVMKKDEATDALDKNHPKDISEEPSMAPKAAQAMDPEKEKKHAKLRAMMMRMGK
jgi:hypothetical protein